MDEQKVDELAAPEMETIQVPSKDWMLENLIASANHADGYQLPITLMANGLLVTGLLIGLKEYFELYGQWWNTPTGRDENGIEIERFWKSEAEAAAKDLREKNEMEFNYIHLKEAHVVGGFGMIPATQGMLWRGRLSHVSGFWLGAIKTIKRPSIEVSTTASTAR